MNRMPDALIVVDPRREYIAVIEAQRVGIATVGLIDTDSDPDTVDLPIPGNDDSIRSIELILAKLADAIMEGRASLPPEQQPTPRPRAVAVGNGANSPTGQASPKPAPATVE
jgi:small subunit ribosomal protein S2